MDALFELFSSLVNLLWSVQDVVVNLVRVTLPWLPLLGWLGFWTFADNWAKAFPILRHGGFIALHGNAGVSPVVGLVVLNHLRLCMTIQPTSPTTTSTRPGTQ